MIKNFKIFLVSLLGTIAFTSPAYAGPVIPILIGAAVGAGAAALGFIGVSVLTAAAIGAAVGAVVGVLGGDLLGGMFDVPDYNVTQNAQAVNDGILVNKTGMLENIPVVYGQRKVGGKTVFLATGGDRNKYLYMAVVMSEGEIDSIGDVYIDDVISTDSKFRDRLSFEKFTGTDNQSASNLLSEANGWTSSHKLSGLAYLACRFEWKKIEDQDDADANPYNGIPKVNAVIKGRKVKDATLAGSVAYGSETGLSWSSNPADNLLDYLRNPRYGRGLDNTRINFSSFSTVKSKLAQTVQYVTGSSGPAVTCDAVIDTGRSLFDNTKLFLANMRSGMPYIQGQFTLKLQDTGNSSNAQNPTPTTTSIGANGTVDEDIIIGGLKITGTGVKTHFNQLKITYVDPNNEWKTNEVIYPAVGSARDIALLAEDSNRRLTKDMAFNHIINKNVAADLAHIILETSRKKKHIEFTGTAELHDAIVGDIITVTYAPLGISSIKYRIRSMKMNNDYTFTVTAEEHEASNYVFQDNNAIYGSESQKKYVGELTTNRYYFWNGSEWDSASVPPATINEPTLPSAPVTINASNLGIDSITEFSLRDTPSNPQVLLQFNFTMSDAIKDTTTSIALEEKDPLTGKFVQTLLGFPNTFENVSGTTYKVRAFTKLDGALHTFRFVANLDNGDKIPSAVSTITVSQSAFNKSLTASL